MQGFFEASAFYYSSMVWNLLPMVLKRSDLNFRNSVFQDIFKKTRRNVYLLLI